MKRKIRLPERGLLLGLYAILIFMLVQDWVPLGSLNDVDSVFQVHSFTDILTSTLINAGQFVLLIFIVRLFIGRRYPVWARLWLIIHQGFIFAGALMAWWIPYLFGVGAEEKAEPYRIMFGSTHSFLPEMNGITPNTLHTGLHAVLLICLLLTIYITFTGPKKTKKRKKSRRTH
ncbi:MAG: hypothetical protein ACI33O_04305 [Bhargavaea sp.]